MASPSLNTTGNPHPLPIPDIEAKNYYYGLYSRPVLVARTSSDTWMLPSGPEAFLKPKELRPVNEHPLSDVWEESLAFEIHEVLETNEVKWTSTDLIRIGFMGESAAPIVIWIGVIPGTLSCNQGQRVAKECKQLLVMHDISDIEVEICEAVVTGYINAKLRKPVSSVDPTAPLVLPLTPTLGLSICNTRTPLSEGTGGFFLSDDKSQLYLVTARHVVFKADIKNNKLYKCKPPSKPPFEIALFGTAGFKNYVAWIELAVKKKHIVSELQASRVKAVGECQDRVDTDEHELELELADTAKQMKEAVDTIVAFEKLLKDVKQVWGNISNRILGHIEFSPPIRLWTGTKKCTQDYALIKMNGSIMKATGFTGNTLDLGTDIPPDQLTLMISNPKNHYNFTYPPDRLLKVRGIIPDAEMRKPQMYDGNNKRCLIVLKRGHATGLTLGCATGIKSFLRNYFSDSPPKVSKEWAILPFDTKLGPFAAPGDSGSAIIDPLGRIGGLLTGGSGNSGSSDITYATPISFILESLKAHGYNVTIDITLPS